MFIKPTVNDLRWLDRSLHAVLGDEKLWRKAWRHRGAILIQRDNSAYFQSKGIQSVTFVLGTWTINRNMQH